MVKYWVVRKIVDELSNKGLTLYFRQKIRLVHIEMFAGDKLLHKLGIFIVERAENIV